MDDWWSDCYTGLWLDFLRKHWATPSGRERIGRILSLMKIVAPSRILDVPCAGGSVGIDLASRGHCVTCVDISADFIRAGRMAALSHGVAIRWCEMDMRRIPWETEFEAAMCLTGSFGYFSHEENVAFVSAIHRSLVYGGVFCFDVLPTEALQWLQPHSRAILDDIMLEEDRRYDARRKTVEFTMTLKREGRKQTSKASVRLYSTAEIVDILLNMGFYDVKFYGSAEGELFNYASSSAFVVARKAP